MSLQIYNTLTKQKETFTPLDGNKVKMYVCGMTVYDFCHIGHARVMVCFDVIVRWLRKLGYEVTYVRNITDIDDKIIERAKTNGENFTDLTKRMIEAMHQDEQTLGVLPPNIEPRATAHIEQMHQMIGKLIANDYAYVAVNGDVYYRTAKFAEYGKLSRRKLDELQAGARIAPGEFKQDALDFVLWKSAKEGEPSWNSPWGKGRPGWHIECSVMSNCCLGESFDIHGGGPDLVFPHHENEIAQSEAANGKMYAKTWMHAGAVRVDGEKMSKSLGNFFTIREVIAKYKPEVIRYLLLASHYRSPLNYSEVNLQEAEHALTRLYNAVRNLPHSDVPINEPFSQNFTNAMNDDFATPQALAVLFDLARKINSLRDTDIEQAAQLATVLRKLAANLGILQTEPDTFLQKDLKNIDTKKIEQLIQLRIEARKAKNWAESDRIREQLAQMNVIVADTKNGSTWKLA